MTHSSQIMNSVARCFVRAWTLVLFCLPTITQEKPSSGLLTANEVMQRVVQMNELRAKAIDDYSSIRTYHLESRGLSHEVADMVVRVDYKAPNTKKFTIVSESGSDTARKRVFKKRLRRNKSRWTMTTSDVLQSLRKTIHFDCSNAAGQKQTNSTY